jgi:hypothetical protein
MSHRDDDEEDGEGEEGDDNGIDDSTSHATIPGESKRTSRPIADVNNTTATGDADDDGDNNDDEGDEGV